jgi:hypothetical protein
VCRLGAEVQLRHLLGECRGLFIRNGSAPPERSVAIATDLAPINAERSSGPALHRREVALPEYRDELFAERPCPLLTGDVAFQT